MSAEDTATHSAYRYTCALRDYQNWTVAQAKVALAPVDAAEPNDAAYAYLLRHVAWQYKLDLNDDKQMLLLHQLCAVAIRDAASEAVPE